MRKEEKRFAKSTPERARDISENVEVTGAITRIQERVRNLENAFSRNPGVFPGFRHGAILELTTLHSLLANENPNWPLFAERLINFVCTINWSLRDEFPDIGYNALMLELEWASWVPSISRDHGLPN